MHVILIHAFFFFLKRTFFWHSWLDCYRLLNVRWKNGILRILAWPWAKATIVLCLVRWKLWEKIGILVWWLTLLVYALVWKRVERWITSISLTTIILRHWRIVSCLVIRLCLEFLRLQIILAKYLTYVPDQLVRVLCLQIV